MADARRNDSPRMTVAEFLEWDSGDDRRYELVDGEIRMMAPVSDSHGTLVSRLSAKLTQVLDARPPCRVRTEAGIARAECDDRYFQADLAVTCAPPQGNRPITVDPIVIIEVLSASTEDHDRKIKVPDYRLIPSVREIVLVDQRRPYVEVIRRLDASRWLTVLTIGLDAVLHLDSVPLDVAMAELYRNVELEAALEEAPLP